MRDMQLLLRQIDLHIDSLSDVISGIRTKRYPTLGPSYLVHLIELLAEEVQKTAVTRARQAELSAGSVASTFTRFYIHALQDLASHLRYVERAATDKVLPGSVQTVTSIARQLYPDAVFVVRPQWHFNYSLTQPVSTYRSAYTNNSGREDVSSGLISSKAFERILNCVLPSGKSRILVLGFPRIEKDRSLFHVALGHELGHPLADEYLSKSEVLPREGSRDSMHAECKREGTGGMRRPEDLSVLRDQARATDETLQLCRRALVELIADSVCLHIYGYAAIAYTAWIGQMQGLDVCWRSPVEDHYPPWRYRLRNMVLSLPEDWVEQFKKQSRMGPDARSRFDHRWSEILELTQSKSDVDSINKKPELRQAYELLGTFLPQALDDIAETMASRGLAISDIPGLARWELVEVLRSDYPPDQVLLTDSDEPDWLEAEFRGILNAAWLSRTCFDEDTSPLDKVIAPKGQGGCWLPTAKKRDRLVEKALDNAALREAWRRRS